MAEVLIVPVGSVAAKSLRDLRKAGIVVVESDAPERCQFIRAGEVVSGDDMLYAAMKAVTFVGGTQSVGGAQRKKFADTVAEIVERAWKRREAAQADAAVDPHVASQRRLTTRDSL